MSIKGIGSGGPGPIRPAAEKPETKQADSTPAARTSGDHYESTTPATGLGALLGQPRGGGGEEHVIAITPDEDRSVKLNPGEEQGIRFAPGEDRGIKLNPGEEQGIRFAPGEDRGIKLNPGEEQGIRFAPGEDRGIKLNPGAGEVRATGLSPASGEVRATGLSPADPGGVALNLPKKPASEE